MPNYLHFGDIPKKRHIRLSRDKDKSFKSEGIAYEHVVTTEDLTFTLPKGVAG